MTFEYLEPRNCLLNTKHGGGDSLKIFAKDEHFVAGAAE